MPGKHITKNQVELYMKYKTQAGLNQEAAAAKASRFCRKVATNILGCSCLSGKSM